MNSLSGIRSVAGCLLTVSLFVFAPAAWAQEAAGAAPAPSIAVVDVEGVGQESLAAKSVRAQMERYQQGFREEVSQEENTLKSKQQELQKLSKTVPQEQMLEKARQFESEVAEYRHKTELRSRALDKAYGMAMGQINESMVAVAREVAIAHGANVVLPRSQVIFFDEKMNITREVADGLNKRLPNVTVPAPKLDADAGSPAAGTTKKKTQ